MKTLLAKLATVIFDNAGGATLQLPGFAATFSTPEAAAAEFMAFLSSGDTAGWDGNDADAAGLDPSGDDIRNGGYRVFTGDELAGTDVEDCGWTNVARFVSSIHQFTR